MLTADSTVIGLSFSLPAKGPFYDIELVGFRERELTLIRSVFKLSEMRTRHFRAWDPQSAQKPKAVMVELDAGPEVVISAARMAQGFSAALIGIGTHTPSAELPLHKFIDRPVRWANLITVLDELFQNDGMGASSMGQRDGWADKVPEEIIAEAENQIEDLQLEPRFDPTQKITFHTEPGILVIDPDFTIGRSMRTLLANDGYRVDSVATAAEAYPLLASRRYNLVFTERNVLGVDGLEIAQTIKQREDRRSTTVIMLTSHGSIADRIKAQAAGCKAYWKKPLEEEKFLKLVKKFMPNWVLKKPH